MLIRMCRDPAFLPKTVRLVYIYSTTQIFDLNLHCAPQARGYVFKLTAILEAVVIMFPYLCSVVTGCLGSNLLRGISPCSWPNDFSIGYYLRTNAHHIKKYMNILD